MVTLLNYLQCSYSIFLLRVVSPVNILGNVHTCIFAVRFPRSNIFIFLFQNRSRESAVRSALGIFNLSWPSRDIRRTIGNIHLQAICGYSVAELPYATNERRFTRPIYSGEYISYFLRDPFVAARTSIYQSTYKCPMRFSLFPPSPPFLSSSLSSSLSLSISRGITPAYEINWRRFIRGIASICLCNREASRCLGHRRTIARMIFKEHRNILKTPLNTAISRVIRTALFIISYVLVTWGNWFLNPMFFFDRKPVEINRGRGKMLLFIIRF